MRNTFLPLWKPPRLQYLAIAASVKEYRSHLQNSEFVSIAAAPDQDFLGDSGLRSTALGILQSDFTCFLLDINLREHLIPHNISLLELLNGYNQEIEQKIKGFFFRTLLHPVKISHKRRCH
jgi:hypothetical protein